MWFVDAWLFVLYCVAGEGKNEKHDEVLPVEHPEFDEPKFLYDGIIN